MKKALALTVVGLVALAVVAKTNLFSYAGTFWSQVERETKKQIPTKFELERIRNEIANLDTDVDRMIRPVAEYKACIDRMRKDLTKTQANLDEQKQTLQTMVTDLKGNPEHVVYGGERYPACRVKQKLAKDFEAFKRLEATVATQHKLLEAKEQALKASQEQLAKVIAKKREYELRVAQLEAEEETLQVARIGTKVQIDTSRATQIEAALTELERQMDTDRAEITMRSGALLNDIPVHQRGQAGVDVDAIADYLENGRTATASNK
jgi:chromosome segregation ATPase